MVGNLEVFLYRNIFKNKVNFQQNFNILLIYNQTNIYGMMYTKICFGLLTFTLLNNSILGCFWWMAWRFEVNHEHCAFLVGYTYKNVNISNRTNFLQCHHGFSLSRDTKEGFYVWGQMLYFRFGYPSKMWGLLLHYYELCKENNCKVDFLIGSDPPPWRKFLDPRLQQCKSITPWQIYGCVVRKEM